MGTTFDVTVYRPSTESALADVDLESAFDVVRKIDQLMSLYRDDSELTALNKGAGGGETKISAPLADILQASVFYTRLSDGAFDVTVQPLVDLWGFYRVANATIPPESEIKKTLETVGMDHLSLDKSARTATLDTGAKIDLGAIAKGYAIDRVIAVLHERSVPAALVNLGGTVRVLGKAPGHRPWIIGIRHPRENRLIGEVRLERGAISTSGDYDRYFEADGQRYSHIIDPRSGQPVQGVYAMTVLAPNATTADALSTAAFVANGLDLLLECRNVSGLKIEPQNSDDQETSPDTLLFTVTSEPDFPVKAPFTSYEHPSVHPLISTIDHSAYRDCVWQIDN